MARWDLEGPFREDLLEALTPSEGGKQIWIDHPFLWLYEKWRLAGNSHQEIFDLLHAPNICWNMTPEQKQSVEEGVTFLDRLWAGPHEVPIPDEVPRRERETAEKILEGRYPTPDDLRSLPRRRVRFSAIVSTMRRIVEQRTTSGETDFKPSGDGVLISRAVDGSYRTHRSIEIGMGKYSDPVCLDTPCLEDAVRLLLHDLWGSELEKLSIDWRH